MSSAGKTLLKNVIRHTDMHNRLVEEADMWRIHTNTPSHQHDDRDDRKTMYDRGENSSRARAHMDTEGSRSTFWLREMDKAESQMGDRWGHGGYKELYPEDFTSDRSDNEQKHRKRKKKHKKQKLKKHKRKKLDDVKDLSDSETEGEKSRSQHKKRSKEHKRKSHDKLSSDRKVKSKHKRRKDTDRSGSEKKRKRVASSLSDDTDSASESRFSKHSKERRF